MTTQKKTIWAIAVLIGMPVGMYLIGLAVPKRYTAEMRLLVDQSMQHSQYVANPYQYVDDISEFSRPRSTQTQLDILTGSDVLQRAMELGAQHMPNKIKGDHDTAALEDLLRRVAVENELNSDILTVRVTQSDPEVAAELANDIGDSYAEFVKSLARTGGSDELRALETAIKDSKATLTSMDRQIAVLKAKSNIFDPMQSGLAEAGTKSAHDQKLAQIEGEYNGQTAALSVAEAQLHTMSPTIVSDNRNSVNPLALNLTQALANEETALVDLRTQYHDDFPYVKKEKQRIQEIERQLKAVEKEIPSENDTSPNPVYQAQLENVQNLRSQVQSLRLQVEVLKAASQRSAGILAAIPSAEQQLQALIRVRTVAEQNFEQLEQRRTLVQSSGYSRQPSAKIVSTALPPTRASFPDQRLLTLGGFALGAFFAVLILMPRAQNVDGYAGGYGSLPREEPYNQLSEGHQPGDQSIVKQPGSGNLPDDN